MPLFPKEVDFFSILDRAADNLSRATSVLVDLLNDFNGVEKKIAVIHEHEQSGDVLTHDIMVELNKTFITALDREDIHALASRIDDVLDLVWGAADRIAVYRMEKPTPEALALAEDVQAGVAVLKKALTAVKTKAYPLVREYCIEINRIENRIDRTFRDALGRLMNDSSDPVYIIKWKDVYQRLEDAGDKAEDIANILEGIVLKSG